MSLLFMDGMDLYGVTADLATRYSGVDASVAFGATQGRFGGGGIKVTDDDRYFSADVPGTPQTVVISFAIFRLNVSTGADTVCQFDNNVNRGAIIFKTTGAAGVIEVKKGASVSLGTFSLSAGVWHWISIKIKAANTGGTVDVEVDGTNVFSFSGDTVSSGNETIDTIRLGGDIIQDFTYDDLIITDVAGGAPFNDLLSDRRIDTILPDAAGDSSGFTATPSVANFLNVDDTAPDGDTTHNEAETSGTKDLYNMAAMGFTPSSIDLVNVVALAKNPDAGGTQFKLKTKTGATEGTGSAKSPTSDYLYFDEQFLTDPDTAAAWTESGVNGMQAGMEIV